MVAVTQAHWSVQHTAVYPNLGTKVMLTKTLATISVTPENTALPEKPRA